MPKMIMLVGPPGSGKSTLAKQYEAQGFVRISQDDQGKGGHQELFMESGRAGKDIVVDRMNFSVQQRANYLAHGKIHGYEIEIVVLHQNYETCLKRVLARQGHPTITDEQGARSALQTFFTKYERPQPGEADTITFTYPEGKKPKAIICDLDGTLCDVEHRRHHVRPADGSKKNWKAFFDGIPDDPVNQWCASILESMGESYQIVYCSGRDDNQRKMTVDWLKKNHLDTFYGDVAPLYMRNRVDSRPDFIVKEIILDFELLTRYTPYFMIDDRKSVVEMWRKRGFVCLQCDEGDF